MKQFILIFISSLALLVKSAPKITQYSDAAPPCNLEKCKLPNCLCSSTSIPGNFTAESIPQIVLFTFDDAVEERFMTYFEQAFFNKQNPDKCPIQPTYFVSHEYSDYHIINQLYNRGYEIALHSITHTSLTDYWRSATVDTLKKEFIGEQQLISHFANISENQFQGIRIPFLQLSGDNSFQMINENNLKYDCSWPTQNFMDPPLWPYTLDYESIQDCQIGPCPSSSFPSTWVVPMVNWEDDSGVVCSMVDACVNIPKDVDGLFEFMQRNFLRHYQSNRAPFGFFIHVSWFLIDNTRFEAYLKFIDYLQSLPDVYITSIKRMLEWVQNPSDLNNLKKSWPNCSQIKPTDCNKYQCNLKKENEERWFTFCGTECPNNYPWIDNPLGN